MTANFNMTTNLILTNVIVLQLFAPMDIFVVVKKKIVATRQAENVPKMLFWLEL